jgi:hypothetical protein
MTFNNLITKMICILHKSPTFHHVNTQELLVVLYQLKNSKKILLNKDIDFNYKTYGIPDTSNTICDLLNLILAILVVLYLYLRVIIMTILQPGDCYESLWATCLRKSNRHKYNI